MTNKRVIIHLGDAGMAGLKCSAKSVGRVPDDYGANWTWRPESVTCKKCLALYKKECIAWNARVKT